MARRGLFMGFTGDTSAANLAIISGHGKYIRNGAAEVPWLFAAGRDPNNTSVTGPLDLSGLRADIQRVHNAGLGYIMSFMSTPRCVNPLAGSADVAFHGGGGGEWHHYPTDAAGRMLMADYAVQVANCLDPSKGDMLEVFQEANIWDFNHGSTIPRGTPGYDLDMGYSAETVGNAIAACIVAVRANGPAGLPIIAGSIANRGVYGDYGDPAVTNRFDAPSFFQDMLDTVPALVDGNAVPDYWGMHPYTGLSNPADQQDMGGTGQLLACYFVMRSYQCLKPSGAQAQLALTEFGWYYSDPSPTGHYAGTSQTTQRDMLKAAVDPNINAATGRPNGVYDQFRLDGWVGGPECYYTVRAPIGSNGRTTDGKEIFAWDSTPLLAGTWWLLAAEYDVSAPQAPVASFAYSPTSGSAPLTVGFIDTSTNTPTSWSWDFGDGNTSVVRNPSHVFTADGTYTVRLTARNAAGQSTVSHVVSVVTSQTGPTGPTGPTNPPVASYSYSPSSGDAPLTVSFLDTSTNTPTSWSWVFGDGLTSTQKSPTHTFTASGTYHVAMTATNSLGSDTISHTVSVTKAVTGPPQTGPTGTPSGPIVTGPGTDTGSIVQGIELTWNPTNLGARFAFYEIQRWDDDTGYQRIARITEEAVNDFIDWECRRTVPVVYRMRVVRDDAIFSTWTAPITTSIIPSRVGTWLVTNEDPNLNIAAEDVGGTRVYDPDQGGKYVDLYGRDGGVSFRDLYRRGDKFKIKLLFYNLGAPYRPAPHEGGRTAFTKLDRIAMADISYVCVLDERGGRWFSQITPSNLTVQGESQFYTADLDIQQVTFRPSWVDVDV